LNYDVQDNAKEESASVSDIDRSGVAAGHPAVPFDRHAVTNNITSNKRNTRKKNDMLLPHACKSACLEFR